jgi:TetR/AcrR family fatty acid metabolism transcriptional regulator
MNMQVEGGPVMQTTSASRSLKERQRQEREALILQVAEEVLLEKGYYETSIDEIAARVGIAKGTVYLHFPSKEDLVIAIFARDMRSFLQNIDKAVETKPTSQAKLEAILHLLYTGLFCKHAQFIYNMYSNVDMHRLFKEKGTRMRELWEQFAARVRLLLEEGKRGGEFDATIPTEVMLTAFFNLLSPRVRLMRGEQMPTEDLMNHLARIYFRGVAATS